MIGTLFWIAAGLLAVATICITVWYLSESSAKDAIGNAAHQQGVQGWVQGVIDSVGDNHAKFSLSHNGSHFANLDITYEDRSSSMYSGRTIGTYA